MDVSGASSPSATMLANIATKTETSVTMHKKELEMEKQTAEKLIASIEQSAPKPASTGAVGSNIDIMV
jgi:DNA-directed RNA polymerase specialized sigma54-like protein